ncbi:hypothetical protein [Streptomyces sp. NPDC048202]|uniref:hypothetical protein n=1 Tax=Streptomyces sp. NPDC048202 TaxID=3365514 RepID=UPI0037105CEA
MSDQFACLVLALGVAVLALALGTRIGCVVASRATAQQLHLMERHFEHSRQLFVRQQELQRETDLMLRSREELKKSYEDLGLWLHRVSRTVDEIHFGALSDDARARDRVRVLLSARPWEVVSPPASLAGAEMCWTAEVLRGIRQLQSPYGEFIRDVRMVQLVRADDGEEASGRHDGGAWASYQALQELLIAVRNQARDDLSTARGLRSPSAPQACDPVS